MSDVLLIDTGKRKRGNSKFLEQPPDVNTEKISQTLSMLRSSGPGSKTLAPDGLYLPHMKLLIIQFLKILFSSNDHSCSKI